MLCSISKSSRSTWLDRLRSSKGFPVPTDLGLEHFLNSGPNPNPTADAPPPENSDSPLPDPSGDQSTVPRRREKHAVTDWKIGDEKERLFDLMSDVLAELFIMGDPKAPPSAGTLGERKNSRKQRNPKLRVPSASASADGSFSAGPQPPFRALAMSPPSANNSVAEARKSRTKPRRKLVSGDPMDSDLSTYSCTEVTVIDTSSPTWKTEKLIYRKGTVWKVRDKKLWHVCRKKRKLGLVEKLIGEKDREQPPIDLKAQAQREPLASLNEALNLTMKQGYTDTYKIDASRGTDDQMQIPIRRPKFSRSPRVPAAKGASRFRSRYQNKQEKWGSLP